MTEHESGPVERHLNRGGWSEQYRARAVALDLAGATQDDLEAALGSLTSMGRAVAPAHAWDYFASVVAARVGTRSLVARRSG